VTLVPDRGCYGAGPVPMTPKAFDLLLVLAETRPAAHEEQLLQAIWSDTAVGGQPLVSRFAIRKRLVIRLRRTITTVPKGYRFTMAVTLEWSSAGPPVLTDNSPEQIGSVSSSQASAASIERLHGGLPARTFSRLFGWRSAVWFGAGAVVAVGVCCLRPQSDGPTADAIRAQISPASSCLKRRRSRSHLMASIWYSPGGEAMESLVCGCDEWGTMPHARSPAPKQRSAG
jgi:DNA-binding winged helix-turn-helix (wHTH) protein